MVQTFLRQKILEKAVSLEKYCMDDLTWEKEDAKALMTSLMPDDIGILGGSVYKIDSDQLIPLYDNWLCQVEDKETRQEFCIKSKIKSLAYIEKYPVYPNEKILFSIVFTEYIDRLN